MEVEGSIARGKMPGQGDQSGAIRAVAPPGAVRRSPRGGHIAVAVKGRSVNNVLVDPILGAGKNLGSSDLASDAGYRLDCDPARIFGVQRARACGECEGAGHQRYDASLSARNPLHDYTSLLQCVAPRYS